MANWTPRQRLLAAIAHQEPDRVPVAPRMHMWSGEQYGDHSWLRQLKLQEEFDSDPIIEVMLPRHLAWFDNYRALHDVSIEMVVEDTGKSRSMRRRFHTPAGELNEVLEWPLGSGGGGNPVRREPLAKGLEDVDKLVFLIPEPHSLVPHNLPLIVEAIGERGLLQVGCGGAAVTTRILGMQNAMLTYYDDREMFDRLVDVFAEHHLAVTKAVLEAGAPVIYNGWHDYGVSTGWSPRIYRNTFKPVIKAVADLVRSYDAIYLYFDNGPIRPLLSDIAEIGVDILSSLCPPPVGDVDLAEAKRLVGEEVCLHGNVDAIYVVHDGTPEQVREAVRQAIAVAAPGGGFILGNSDCFFPGTPRENIVAFFEAARDFGRYPINL